MMYREFKNTVASNMYMAVAETCTWSMHDLFQNFEVLEFGKAIYVKTYKKHAVGN